MTKEQKLVNIKNDIRDRMVTAVFEPMVLTHLDAMELSHDTSELYVHNDHTWFIDRLQSIWTIYCKGLYDWKIQFDVDWKTDSAGLKYMSIDTVVIHYNGILDTVGHLKMAIAFVSNYLAKYCPDGSIYMDGPPDEVI